ncbi:hypothetical protein NUACC21_07530 [Scytonema sp. NUACC21]
MTDRVIGLDELLHSGAYMFPLVNNKLQMIWGGNKSRNVETVKRYFIQQTSSEDSLYALRYRKFFQRNY